MILKNLSVLNCYDFEFIGVVNLWSSLLIVLSECNQKYSRSTTILN